MAKKEKKRRAAEPAEEKEVLDDYAKLDEIDMRVLQLKIEYPNITVDKLSELIGMSNTQIGRRMNAPKWKKAYHDFFREPLDILQGAMRKAAKKYETLLTCGTPAVEERTARYMLISGGILKMKMEIETKSLEPFIVEDSKGAQTVMGQKELPPAKDVTPKGEK